MEKYIYKFAKSYINFMETFFLIIKKVRRFSKKIFSNRLFWIIAGIFTFWIAKSAGTSGIEGGTTGSRSAGKKRKQHDININLK